jgi:hypothetical protein
VTLTPDDELTKEAQEAIFQEIEDTLLRRSLSDKRTTSLVVKAKTAGVSLRMVSEMIFHGRKFWEITAFLEATRRGIVNPGSSRSTNI